MAVKSGHGSTLAFGTSTAFSPGYVSIGGFEASRETLDTSTLATTGARTKIEGDLFDVGAQTHPYLFDPAALGAAEANGIDTLLFDTGDAAASETITITLNGGATVAGSGHVSGFALDDLATDAIIAASITTQFNDWPVFTDEV